MFAKILGQPKAVQLLCGVSARGLRPPFMLFSGPAGVGKRKAALAFAGFFQCRNPSQADSCGACPPCVQISRGHCPDVCMLDLAYQEALLGLRAPAAQIKVEAVREVMLRLQQRPHAGEASFCIIDGAEALTLQSQNAMLKILEESPPHLSWIWLTCNQEALLPTIRSRVSLNVFFPPLPEGVVAGILKHDRGFSDAQAHEAAGAGFGSVERALRHWEAKTGKEALFNVAAPPAAKEALMLARRLFWFKKAAVARDQAFFFLEELKISFYKLWRQAQEPRYLKMLGLILQAQQDLEANLTPTFVMEGLLLKMSR